MSMSVTFDITTPFDLLTPNQPVMVQVAIHNSGASAVQVDTVDVYVSPLDGAYRLGILKPDVPIDVDADSTEYLHVGVVFYAPQNGQGSSIAYTLGVNCLDENGTVFSAPTQVVTVYAPSAAPTPSEEEFGQFDFSEPLNSGLSIFW